MKIFVIVVKNRNMLVNLIKSDFKNRYLGNHLGIIWAFIQPLVMVAVYWFVFVHGFRNTPVENVPFLLWLLAGLVPWFLLNDAIMSASNAITSQSFLVKKIVFEVKLLPFVKIGSAVLVNIAFWALMLIVCLCYGYYPDIYWLQLIYFMACIIAISLSLSLLLSAIMPFLPDVSQILSIFLQIMFWATPIFWNPTLLHGKLIYIVKLNPFAYIVLGFRDSVIYHEPFWHRPVMMTYFWCLTLFLYWLGNRTFNKLRPHFADVL